MKTGTQMNILLQSLQAKLETQSRDTEAQTQRMLNDFEQRLSQALSAAQQKIANDMRDLEKLGSAIHSRTALQIEEQARKIQEATADLEARRTEWRTTTWTTMLPTYLIGVFMTFWVLLMAVQLTFPKPQTATQGPNLATFGLEGTRVTHGLGGLGRVVNLPRGVELANCPMPNPSGGDVCIKTRTTR